MYLYVPYYHYFFTAQQLYLFSQYFCEVTGKTKQPMMIPSCLFPQGKT